MVSLCSRSFLHLHYHVKPTCRFSLLPDMPNTNQYWTLSLYDNWRLINAVNWDREDSNPDQQDGAIKVESLIQTVLSGH